MRVVQVTGSRTYTEREAVWGRLDELAPDVVITGMARGLDTTAWLWARARKVAVEEFPADWAGLGKGAGARRNRVMVARCQRLVREGHEVVVEAWMKPGSRGTADMVRVCRLVGLPVVVHEV